MPEIDHLGILSGHNPDNSPRLRIPDYVSIPVQQTSATLSSLEIVKPAHSLGSGQQPHSIVQGLPPPPMLQIVFDEVINIIDRTAGLTMLGLYHHHWHRLPAPEDVDEALEQGPFLHTTYSGSGKTKS
jgi:hypothetical protein